MILIWYIVASLTVMIGVGVQALTSMLFNKINFTSKVVQFIFPLCFLGMFFMMNALSPVRIPVLNIAGIFSLKNLIILSATVVITSFIVSFEKSEKHNLFEWCIQGVAMEIPQRLFMQTFFMIVLRTMGIENADWIAVLMNSVLWIQFIIIQDIMCGQKVNRKAIPKVLSSLVFSLGTGVLYVSSGCIVLTMFAHGAERIMSEKLRELK